MRIANVSGRLAIEADGRFVDVETASKGRFGADPQAIYDEWSEFVAWASAGVDASSGVPTAEADLQVPTPQPRQIIAIGLNYRDHAIESNLDIPEHPVVFAKLMSSLTGPNATVELPSDGIDWEVELVAVMGKEVHKVGRDEAWSAVAGLTIGQDLSYRAVQLRGPAPQFTIGKSYPGFSPVGPVVVTPDEFANRDDLRISCSLNGETLQDGRTGDLIFDIPELVSRLSQAITLYPGDIIFTGTPAGVGAGRNPKRFLVPGTLVSSVEGIGDLSITLVNAF